MLDALPQVSGKISAAFECRPTLVTSVPCGCKFMPLFVSPTAGATSLRRSRTRRWNNATNVTETNAPQQKTIIRIAMRHLLMAIPLSNPVHREFCRTDKRVPSGLAATLL